MTQPALRSMENMYFLFWFGLVFEKERGQDTSHQGVEVLGLHWGSSSVNMGKERG